MQIDKKNIHYVDIPDIAETFIDSFHHTSFDGTTFRLELCSTRMDEPKPPAPLTAKQYPICRLVMPPQTMRNVEKALLDLGLDGGEGGGDDSSTFVYAYKKTSITDP